MDTFKSLNKVMEGENLNETHDSHNGLSCIITNLWLENIRNLNFIEQKYIEVFDSPQDDLLSHFDETYEFIENGLKEDVVLVHCYHGISRSATVLISYIMKKKKMTLKEALEFVKTKCKFIEPNPGFLDQLKLYEIMKCTVVKTNPQYKMFRLDMALPYVRKMNALPDQFSDVVQNDPLIMPPNADPVVYKCRKCRRVLARGLNEITHAPNGKYDWRASSLSGCMEETDVCQLTYFIEPLVWMENVSVSVEGKIYCPNVTCRNRLGSFNWVSGAQCLCGTKVCPGFYLIPSKVDKQSTCKSKANKVN